MKLRIKTLKLEEYENIASLLQETEDLLQQSNKIEQEKYVCNVTKYDVLLFDVSILFFFFARIYEVISNQLIFTLLSVNKIIFKISLLCDHHYNKP